MRIFLIAILLTPVWAQEPPSAEGAIPRRPMPEPKNLQVLKIPTSELIPTMRMFNASLGVRCDYCHVQGNFASDDNPHKNVAREMIRMTQQINTHFQGNANRVGCFTCHRGAAEPPSAPPASAEQPKPPAGEQLKPPQQ